MSIVSYAQNFEDVMLWRALRHIENGFYIDVGANDPTIDSVTKAFYERGWHGINIEPLPSYHEDLLRDRPRDINLQCAAGDRNGEIEVWECDVRGWASASVRVVTQHTENGHVGVVHKVPVTMLADICAHYVNDEIHFLKIDVEGFEKAVIDGMNFSRFRPWILVIEATKPNSTEEIHDEWERDVFAADYSLAYCDGLNRFYVAREHPELLNSLRYPPNVFDGFIRSEQLNSELRAQQAEVKAQQAEVKAQQAEVKAQQAEVKAQQAEVKAQQAEAKAQQAEVKAQQAEVKAQQAEVKAQQAEAKAQQAEAKAQQAEAKAQQAEAKAQQAEAASNERLAQLHAVFASSSWKLTRPLRGIKRVLSGDYSPIERSTAAAKLKTKQTFRPLVSSSLAYVLQRPLLRNIFSPCLKCFPSLHRRLLRVAENTGLVKRAGGDSSMQLTLDDANSVRSSLLHEQAMTPRARQIYRDLKTAIETKSKEAA